MLNDKLKKQLIFVGLVATVFYIACFALLEVHEFTNWSLLPFVESLIGVFMGAGAIAIITGIILIFQSSLQSQQEKGQEVFEEKLKLYKKVINQMEEAFRVQKGEKTSSITEEEKFDLYFTQLNIALLSKPKTFRSFSKLIDDIAEEDGSLKEDATELLLNFIIDARNDLDVQEKMTDQDLYDFNAAKKLAKAQAYKVTKLNYSVVGEKVIAECKVSLNDKLHHLKRYQSQKIRIEINGEEVGIGKVKPLLKEIIKEYKIKHIQTEDDPDGKRTQTQKIGREVIEHFMKKGNN